jgi:phosphotriesterase-related protein
MTTTVKGVVSENDLGIVALHEHLLYGLPGWENDPSVAFDRPKAFDALVAMLREFKQAGGETVVDGGGTFGGRDAEMLANLASSSGVNIVASSGLLDESAVPGYFLVPLAQRALRARVLEGGTLWIPDADYLAGLIQGELTEGMTATGMNRTKARAGVIVAASSSDAVREIEEIAIRGAAIAARKTGAAVYAGGGKQAQRQFELMTGAGLAPERIVVGHCDDARALDAKRDRELAGKGASIAYDHIGWEEGAAHAISDEQRVSLVKEMVAAGLAERVVLSCSAIGCGLGMPQTNHRFARLLTDFVPRLKKAGVGEQAIHTMLAANPKRILTGA